MIDKWLTKDKKNKKKKVNKLVGCAATAIVATAILPSILKK